jgi:hypothetical protein
MLAPEGREVRRARRALYRAHHPDLGGDAQELVHHVLALEAGQEFTMSRSQDVVFVQRRRLDRLRAWAARRHRPPRVV